MVRKRSRRSGFRPKKGKVKWSTKPLGDLLQRVVDADRKASRDFDEAAKRYELEHPEKAREIRKLFEW